MAGKPAPVLILLLLVSCSSDPGRAPVRNKPTLPPIPLGGVWHRVEQGESVAVLARRYEVPRSDIEEINGLERWEKLEPGRRVFIPGGRRPATAAEGAGESALATLHGKGEGPQLIWPVRGGKLTSRFGRRGKRPHEGIDIAAAEGTAVLAAAEGVVIYAGSGLRGYGNLILVRHDGGIVTVYAHNRRNLVKEGDRVTQGQVIAEVGHTGRTSGNHLHFEVRRGDTPVDPLDHVKPE